ncbi:GntR family transcriptional regulator [Micromonospora sp. NPDC048986]|uniref:GntR family transcriptional regulator n=1 Tax=Micromonospora sp. NPDC048986 TaxID=3155644 RepID=UPI0033C1851B
MPQADSDQPAYVRVADTLRREIRAGILGVGTLLPSEVNIAKAMNVSRNSVRPALDILRREGLVRTEVGRGTFVRPPVPARRISMNQYREDAATAARTTYPPPPAAADSTLAPHLPTVELTEVPADAGLADLFRIPEGTPLQRRYVIHRVNGTPVQVTTSYYLLDMVQGTWVATPESEPSPGGAIGHLWSLDVQVKKVRPVVTSRPPTTDEAAVLRTERDVLAITRQMLDGSGRVVEVAREIVISSAGVELEYEIDL